MDISMARHNIIEFMIFMGRNNIYIYKPEYKLAYLIDKLYQDEL